MLVEVAGKRGTRRSLYDFACPCAALAGVNLGPSRSRDRSQVMPDWPETVRLPVRAQAPAAVKGVSHTVPAVVLAGVLSGGTGYLLARSISADTLGTALLSAAAVAAWVLVVFAAAVRLTDPVPYKALLGRSGALGD